MKKACGERNRRGKPVIPWEAEEVLMVRAGQNRGAR